MSQLSELKQHIDFPTVNKAVREAKLLNKKRLAVWLAMHLNVVANPKALFDVQIKRIHAVQASADERAARDHPLQPH